MKQAFYFSLIVLLMACNKNNKSEYEKLRENNRFDAIIKLTSGEIKTVKAAGIKAVMDCATFCCGTIIRGTDENNSDVSTNYIAECVSRPGTYPISCRYSTNLASTNAIFYDSQVDNSGSITVSVLNNHHIDGHFSAVCKNSTDSVIVTGTFSGYYEH